MKFCPQCAQPLAEREIDQKIRLVCTSSSCTYVYWNNPIPVVAIIAETNDGIVLARNKNWPAGIFSIITGFLEAGESPNDAAAREMKEELGLDAQQVNFIGVFPFERLNQLMIAYHIKATGTVTLNHELDEFKFVQRNDLAGYKRTQQFMVAEWLKNRSVLE